MLTTADLPEVSRLAASVPPGDNEYPIKRLDEELRGVSDKPPDPRRVAFGAFAAGRLLGTGCATPYDDGTGYVSRIYVAHDARKSGVARRVTAAVEDYLRSHGCATAALHFWGPRASTQRIWIRLGYGRNGARGVKHDDVRGFVVSAKKLL